MTRLHRSTLGSLLILIALVSCTSGDEPADSADPAAGPRIIRGYYVFGHEVREFRPCGEDEALWVIDQTALLKSLHFELAAGTMPYAEVFVVVAGRTGAPPADGFGADYAGAVTIEEVIYAALEGFGCDFDWSRFTYRAQGNEPSWTLEVTPAGMRLIRPGHPDLTWEGVEEITVLNAVVFRATGDDTHPGVKLYIEPGPIRDTMSGAYYGLSAKLVLDGEAFAGSALRGSAE
jgi:uncharacterized membrane protein